MLKKRTTRKQAFSLFLIILILYLFPFFQYYSLSQGDFFSQNLKFEASDTLSQFGAVPNKLKAFASNGYAYFFFRDDTILLDLHFFPLCISEPNFIPVVLRC